MKSKIQAFYSAGKESTCNAGDLGVIPGLGRPPEQGKGYPLQYSGLENYMDCITHGVAKSRTRLSDFHFIHFSVYLGLLNFLSVMFYSLQNIMYIHLKFIPEYFILFNTVV